MSGPHQFPNVRDKLSAPSKKSAFEKARLEAEEKRKREEAETAAVYKDFVASFDEGPSPSDAPPASSIRRGGFRGGAGAAAGAAGGGGGAGGPGRRHFSGAPVAPLPRKRGIGDVFERDEEEGGVFGAAAAAATTMTTTTTTTTTTMTGTMTGTIGVGEREKRRMKEGNTGLLAFENSGSKRGARYGVAAGDDSDSDTAAPHPKPTLLLSSLPPNITKTTVSELLATTPLKIDSIRIIPAPPPPGPSQPSPSVRKAASALVTLSSETPSSDIDAAVSSLNGRYMGFGFWLGIVRHLSSTVAGNTPSHIGPQSHPFGAKAPRPVGPTGGGRGPHRGGFAPPSSFGPPGRAQLQQQQQQQSGALQVHVQPPQDLKVLKLIHRMVESLLTHGTEFEALLMSQDAVRNDPKFAWLWDARSPAGVYYRWKLWEIVTGYSIDKPYTPTVDIFDPTGSAAVVWVPPKKSLKYEWAGSLQDVVEDYEFMSDELDEDDSDHDPDHHHEDRPIGLSSSDPKKQKGYLGVLERAKLLHLISRIPRTTSKVRRGDIGRVMAFAMEHAEGGMGEEVVDILVSNVLKPLSFTLIDATTTTATIDPADTDTSSAKIIALWVISDVLSNSSLGVRAAWRYRQLFDTALREKKVFLHLGEIYRDSGWGRMKAEKFRRMIVEGVLGGWEKWCIFPQSTHEHFQQTFLHAPSSAAASSSKPLSQTSPPPTAAAATAAVAASVPAAATKSRWKTVDAVPSVFNPELPPAEDDEDIDGVPMEEDDNDDDVDGEPMVEDDDDDDGEPMGDEAEPEKAEAEVEKKRKEPEEEKGEEEEEEEVATATKPTLGFGGVTGFKMGGAAAAAGVPKRKRPKAEDMFADDYD